MRHYLDFEKPIAELEGKIEELRQMGEGDGVDDGARNAGINIDEEIARLRDVPVEAIAQATTANFFRLFRIDPGLH